MLSKVRYFIPLAIAISGICGLIFLTIQQNLRMSANDPQIQMSEDYAYLMSKNAFPLTSLYQVPMKLDLENEYTPFMIFYDDSGKELISTGQLDGKTPLLPPGVLDYVKNHGEDRITWQPKPGVRLASVINHFASSKSAGFVLVGRNLREVERREDQLLIQVAVGWTTTIIATFIAVLLLVEPKRKK